MMLSTSAASARADITARVAVAPHGDEPADKYWVMMTFTGADISYFRSRLNKYNYLERSQLSLLNKSE